MWQDIVPLIVSIVYVVLLLIVLFNRPWQQQHKSLILYLLAATVWSASDYLLRSGLFPGSQLIIFRIVITASLLWVVQLYNFVLSFLKLRGGVGVWFGYSSLAALAILALLGFAPPGIIYSGGNVSPIYGLWFFFYIIPLIVITSLGVYTLVRRLQTLVNLEERNKVFYLIISAGFLVIFGFLGVTPLAHYFPISHLGGLFSAMILTYAILQHELVSVNLIMRRVLGMTLLSIIGIGMYLSAMYLALHALNVSYNTVTMVLAVIISLIVVLIVNQLRSIVMGKLERLFYREKYQLRRELYNFVKNRISGIFSLQELSQGLLPPLIKALDCQRAFMLIPSNVSGDFDAGFYEPPLEAKPDLKLRKESPIINRLKKEYLTKNNLDIEAEFRGIWKEERDQICNLGIELLFPLVSRNNLVGILALGKKHAGKYSLEDTNLIESIAGQVAVTLEKEYYQEELLKRERELTLINRLTRVITSSLNIKDVYDTFIDGLRETIDVNFATIALIDAGELCFSVLTTEVGSQWNIGDRISLKGTPAEWVIKNRRSLLEDDLSKDRIFVADDEFLARGIYSIIYLPIIVKGAGIGSLIIASKRPKAYSIEQVNLLERLTSQIATSLDNAHLYEKAEQRARVDELTDLFNRRHFDEVLSTELKRHSRSGSSFTIALIDVDNFKTYNDTFGHTAGDKLLSQIARSLKSAVRETDFAFRYGGDELAIIMSQTNIDDAYRAAERVRKMTTEDNSCPVTLSIGLASWPNDGLLPDEVMNAADTALYHGKRTGGNRTCIISQVVPMTNETKETRATEKESLNTIHALAATIEARDAYTYGHSRKVRSYAVALAEALHFSEERVSIISHAALLHDIGKIGILDGILNKPESLGPNEWEIIKSHPQLSRNIVAHMQSLTPCLPAILHHHERWDGTGYPSGLKGEMIPIDARILVIADAFDAMTSNRPYRVSLSLKEAVRELQKGSGVQFDPQLIHIFIPVVLVMDSQTLKVV